MNLPATSLALPLPRSRTAALAAPKTDRPGDGCAQSVVPARAAALDESFRATVLDPEAFLPWLREVARQVSQPLRMPA